MKPSDERSTVPGGDAALKPPELIERIGFRLKLSFPDLLAREDRLEAARGETKSDTP